MLQNLGGRDASKIVLTIQASGRAGERMPRTKGVWITYEGVAAPSQSLWIMASTGDHAICLAVPPPLPEKYMDPGPLLVQCAAIPPRPLLLMHAVSPP